MEMFFLIILVSFFMFMFAALYINMKKTITERKLPFPPCPFRIPIIGNFQPLNLALSKLDLNPIFRSFHAKLGPIITIHVATSSAIFIADGSLAHRALIQNGAVFADRPGILALERIAGVNQHNITSSFYGPTWRLLRRNLISQLLNTSNVRSHSPARKWVLQMLQDSIESEARAGHPVRVMGCIHHAMFSLLVRMCFGDKIDKEMIDRIEEVQRRVILNNRRFNAINLWPAVTKVLFRRSWQFYLQLRKEQEDVLIPLIRARRKKIIEQETRRCHDEKDHHLITTTYVDTLFPLVLPDENRKLDDGQIVTLCSEFLNSGTDTTSTELQWIMANLVKYPRIQEKLVKEIEEVILGNGKNLQEQVVPEEDLQKMTYLKAIVLEGLRRHPPATFVLPHAVTEDAVQLGKYRIPKNTSVNFMISEIGRDPKVWEDPMEFKPERFSSKNKGGEEEEEEAFDISGSREIKMMPFGVGRRMCPAYRLAMLHLEYFVANLVWKFEWKAVEEEDVDLSEKEEFTLVMKNPLRACISPRTIV